MLVSHMFPTGALIFENSLGMHDTEPYVGKTLDILRISAEYLAKLFSTCHK